MMKKIAKLIALELSTGAAVITIARNIKKFFKLVEE